MIKKVIRKIDMKNDDSIKEDLKYWLGKDPNDRILAVEYLRRQFNGNSDRLQRVARVTNLSEFGRKKDLADLEALGIDY